MYAESDEYESEFFSLVEVRPPETSVRRGAPFIRTPTYMFIRDDFDAELLAYAMAYPVIPHRVAERLEE